MLSIARLAQAGAHQQAAEAAADDRHLDVVEERLAGEAGLDVRVVDVVRELGRDLDVLVVGVGAQALVALLAVLLPQRVGIEGNVADQFGDRWLYLHADDRTDACPRWPTRSAAFWAIRCGCSQGPRVLTRGVDGSDRPGGSRRMC